MKNLIKDILQTWLELMIIALIVICSWQGLEILIIGKINPNAVDSIIGLILVFSLHSNFNAWKNKKNNK